MPKYEECRKCRYPFSPNEKIMEHDPCPHLSNDNYRICAQCGNIFNSNDSEIICKGCSVDNDDYWLT